ISAVFIFFLIAANDDLSFKIRLLEEDVNKWLWYLKAEENTQAPIPTVILDLYTSESYDASSEKYRERYTMYRLPESLDFFCRLGAQLVVFDVYVDSLHWIGKYLNSKRGQAEAQRLTDALSCYKKILMPVRDNEETKGFFYPVTAIRRLEKKLVYMHADTEGTKLYRPYRSFGTDNGQALFPYSALALSLEFMDGDSIELERYPQRILPLQFMYHPTVFDRARWDEMVGFLNSYMDLSTYLEDEKEIGKILAESYQRDYRKGDEPGVLPKVVMVGFTHDSTDQHVMPYTLAGRIGLSRGGKAGRSAVRKSGEEPEVLFTPGLYAILSTANALAGGFIPRYPVHNWPIAAAVVFGLIFWLAVEWGRHLSADWRRYLFFGALMLAYLSAYVLAFLNQVYLPLFIPLLALFGAMIASTLLYRQVLVKRLLANYRHDRMVLEEKTAETPWELRQPLIISQAEQNLALQREPFSILMAKLDVLEIWIQLLGMFQWADYYYHQQAVSDIAPAKWRSRFDLRKPSLGHYLGAFCQFGKNFASDLDAQRSFFPQFYYALRGTGRKKKQPFEITLDRAVQLRNEWKHEKSSSKSLKEQEVGLIETSQILDRFNESLAFLKEYSLVKPLSIIKVLDGKHIWLCQFYSGASCFLGEIETDPNLVNDTLYLYNHRRTTEPHGAFLRLDPWIAAGECRLHHREEIFVSKELKNGKCIYSGLTAKCKPVFARSYPDDLTL
ncbi:MAG: hypothetical protein GY866_00120, partial [Proteobacteria bacterium]|nr:hypothetical protein [Pseudomonadota bacterium]